MTVQNIAEYREQREQDTQEQEEFLEAEEVEDGEPEKPAMGKVDPTFQDQKSENITVHGENGYKYRIVNETWTPLARAMWQKFSELHDCNPSAILFVEVADAKPKYRGKPKFIDISVTSNRWNEILKQISGFNFTHIVTIYQGNVDKFEQSYEQMLVHLYNALRQIKSDGSLRGYDIHAFTEVYANLKAGWDKEHCAIPNLIETGNWIGMKQLQGNLFGEDRSGENAQAKDF